MKDTKDRDALKRIAEIVNSAIESGDNTEEQPESTENSSGDDIPCSIKALPARLQRKAAEAAIRVNPMNAPIFEMAAGLADSTISDPMSLTVLTSKYWGPAKRELTVSFMETTPANLRARIVLHMNAWNKTAGISFVQTNGIGKVRISRGAGGYWSYLGTDILLIPTNRPTMNLQGFTMNTPESEYKRVVRHEAGHTMGFPHEHMRKALVDRIDRQKAYAYFLATQGWNPAMVDAQVLTPLSAGSIFGTPADQTSIMCYQLPGSITKDGLPIKGGIDINATDYAFAKLIYPKPWLSVQQPAGLTSAGDAWPADEDVSDLDVNSLLEESISQLNGH